MGSAVVIEHFDEVVKLDFTRPIFLYSQTTKSLDEYHRVIDYIQSHMASDVPFRSFDTICRSVANRIPQIRRFAQQHELILFVSGAKSSNGRILFAECLDANPNSHLISSEREIDPAWLKGKERIGICGATSTPRWLMGRVRDAVISLQAH
jgi:4-hydroxy-3-methylbut-2-enyl diphosphate reductase